MKSTAKQEHNLNLKRNSYIPKMCVDPCPVGSTTVAWSVQPIGLYQNEMHLFTVRVELKTICTVYVIVHAELPWWCH